MPSIFDLLNPQQAALAPGVPRPPSILDSPDYRSERMGDALAGMASALVAAGGPSQYPQGIAEAFGAAGAGASKGTQGSEEKYLKRAMVDSQVQKNRAELERLKAMDAFWAGGDSTSGTATAGAGPAVPTATVPAAGGGGPSNPTNPGNLTSGKGGFQSFPTPEAGVAAAIKNVQSYPAKYNGGQPMSLIQIGQAWAPKDDGKDPMLRGNDPVAWANNVARAGGLDPNQPLDFSNPAVGEAFARGVHVAEHGATRSYAPDIYKRGTALAYGNGPPVGAPSGPMSPPAFPQGDAVMPDGTPMVAPGGPVQTDGAPSPVATGGPVQLAQAPGAAAPPAAAQGPQIAMPRTAAEIRDSIPLGVRQFMRGATPEKQIEVLMKYADPGTEPALDTQRNQVVFVPKTMLGRDPRYQPIEGAKLFMEQQRLDLEKERAAREGANAKITVGPGGQPVPNETVLQYERRIKELEDQFKQGEERRKQEAGQSEKTFGQEKQVRQEYETQPAVKSYRVVVPMMEAAAKAGPTRAGDLNLVYAFAKLMDPDSVVRESETAGVVATGNLGDKISGYIGQLNGNPMLSPETRAKLMDELQTRFVALKESNDVLASQYADIAKAYGLDPSRVVIPIRTPGSATSGATAGNQPTQDELKQWSSGVQTGGVRLKYVPGKGTVPVPK